MSEISNHPDPIEELRLALAEGDAVRPPRDLGAQIFGAAMEARAPGRSSDDPTPISPSEAFVRSVASLDALLASLSAEDWHRPALRDLDVQGLVGHLIGVEVAFASALDDPGGADGDADHVASTNALAHGQAAQSPSDTLGDWRAAVEQSLHRLGQVGPEPRSFDATVPLHGVRLPLSALLVVRTFELWTHQEDVRRATERPLQAPDPATLRLMTDVAFALLPRALERTSAQSRRSCTRVVLTGPGGRTWQTPGPEGDRRPRSPDVRIVMDAVHFCRLVGNRVDPTRVTATVTGDAALADDLFITAAALALD